MQSYPERGGVRQPARPGGYSAVSDGTYVALGDSYMAALLPGALHPRSFVNVSCYGAST
jgi:hypothetical protein